MKKMVAITVIGVAMFVVGCTTQNSDRPFSAYARRTYHSDSLIQSQTSVPIELTEDSGLNVYLAYAVQNNPGLEAEFNRWKAAVERIVQIGRAHV